MNRYGSISSRSICRQTRLREQNAIMMQSASNSDRMEADSMQISNAASTSSQPAVASPRKITSFVDRLKITAAQQLRFNTLLCVAFITCGWSFRTVENPEFVAFMRPNYQLPSQCSIESGACCICPVTMVHEDRVYTCRCRYTGWHFVELCGSISHMSQTMPASQQQAPLLHTQGGHTDTFDVRQFLARC
ncbi:TPA: hypothetical protein ACH3X1_015215 [Trebouxia sp. C0004]